jgi:hypothetical protein
VKENERWKGRKTDKIGMEKLKGEKYEEEKEKEKV